MFAGRPRRRRRVRAETVSYCTIFPAIDNDAGPVSYTHLRAHETVLDLVCRLLLEKKNQKRTTPFVCDAAQYITSEEKTPTE